MSVFDASASVVPTGGSAPGGASVVVHRRRKSLELPLAFWLSGLLLTVLTLTGVALILSVLAERAEFDRRADWARRAAAIVESWETDPNDQAAWVALHTLRADVEAARPALLPAIDGALGVEGRSQDFALRFAQGELRKFSVSVMHGGGMAGAGRGAGWGALDVILLLMPLQSVVMFGLLAAWFARGKSASDTRRAMRQTLAELDDARKRAEGESRSKSRFLADVSHELRTPMNGVIGVTELLLGGEISADQRGHLETMQGSGRALMRILDDLLDLSRIEAGVLELACEPFDLHGLVRHRAALNRAAARARGLKFTCVIDPDVPRFLRGDPVRLGQVLGSLVDNAVKFTQEGEVSIQVKINWDCVRFEVRDTGPGIPVEIKERLFEPFVRIDGNRHHSGSGLGLTLCREVVHWMGGELGVESKPGEGALFWFELDLGEGEPTVEAPMPEVSDQHSYVGVRVLVVDDHPINRRVVCAILDKLGIDSDAVVDGTDAVAAVHEGNYDAVLMDVEMPRMNGVEATIAIRREADPIPIIAVTAHAMATTRKACFEAGMDDFIAKPVTMGHLDAVLSRWIRAKRHAVVDEQAAPSV